MQALPRCLQLHRDLPQQGLDWLTCMSKCRPGGTQLSADSSSVATRLSATAPTLLLNEGALWHDATCAPALSQVHLLTMQEMLNKRGAATQGDAFSIGACRLSCKQCEACAKTDNTCRQRNRARAGFLPIDSDDWV